MSFCYFIGCEKVTSKDLSHLFQKLNNLELVDLSECKTGVTNGTLKVLAQNNPRLEHLVLDECDKITGLNKTFSQKHIE